MRNEIYREVSVKQADSKDGLSTCSVVVTKEANGYAVWIEDSRDAKVIGSPEMLTWFSLTKRELALNVAKMETTMDRFCRRKVSEFREASKSGASRNKGR